MASEKCPCGSDLDDFEGYCPVCHGKLCGDCCDEAENHVQNAATAEVDNDDTTGVVKSPGQAFRDGESQL